MAIGTPTVKTENTSAAAASTSVQTASISPAADTLYILTVCTGLTGAAVKPSSVTGNSLTWVEIDSQTTTNSNICVTVYRAMGSTPTSGTITINYATASKALWQVAEWTGTDTGGTNGSGAIAQSAKATGTTNPSCTLGNALGSNTVVAGSICYNSSSTAVTMTSYTELGTQATGTSPSDRRVVIYDMTPGSTTVDAASGAANQYGIVGYEILPPQITLKTGSDTLNVQVTETSTTQNNFTGADTAVNLQVTETQTSLSTLTGADTALGLDENESSATVIVTAVSGADTAVGLDLNESSATVIVTAVSGADTAVNLQITQTSTNQAGITGADTAVNAQVTETQTSLSTLTGADTALGLDENETSLTQANATGADTAVNLDENETGDLLQGWTITYPNTDVYPGSITWPYAESLGGPGSSSDTAVGLQVTETSATLNDFSGADTDGLAVTETSTVLVLVTGADTALGLAVTESSAVVIVTQVAGADTAVGLQITQSSATVIVTNVSGADTAVNLQATEASTTQVGVTGADAAVNLDENETVGTISSVSAASDTLGLAVTEAGALLNAFSGADTALGLDENESSALVDNWIVTYPDTGPPWPSATTWPYAEPAGGPGTSSDTDGLQVTETSAIENQFAGADNNGLAVTESGVVAILTAVSGADTAVGLQVTESSSLVIVASIAGADTAVNLAFTEASLTQANATSADTAVNLDENESGSVSATFTGTYPSLTTWPATDLWPYPGDIVITGAETVGLQLTEAGVLVTASASQEYWGVLQI